MFRLRLQKRARMARQMNFLVLTTCSLNFLCFCFHSPITGWMYVCVCVFLQHKDGAVVFCVIPVRSEVTRSCSYSLFEKRNFAQTDLTQEDTLYYLKIHCIISTYICVCFQTLAFMYMCTVQCDRNTNRIAVLSRGNWVVSL